MICHKYYFVAQQEEREKDKLYKDAAEMSILPVSISYPTSSVFRIVCGQLHTLRKKSAT